MSEQSLKDKTVKGSFWSAADNIANQGITFLVGLVLARLLSPEEYGLIAIITIFINVFNSIVDSGFSNALIRKNNANDLDYNTVFWCNMGISVILCAALFFSAGPIAYFFGRPKLKPMTEVMSLIVVINAFAIIQRTLLVKKIDFKTQTKVSLISSIVSGLVGIGMAIRGYGVWALVGLQVSRQLLNSVLLWLFSTWRPKSIFSVDSFKELFSFGWKLLVSSLIATIWNEMYQVVIGKFYSPVLLGQYTRAQQFGSIFSVNINGVVSRVTYPALSKIQEEKDRLKIAYKRIIRCTMLITFSCMLGLAGCAKSFVYVLVGSKWMECVPMLQVLCFNLMMYPLHSINLNMLQVQGRSDLFLRLEVIKKCIGVVPILLGIFVSFYWMLYASVISGFFAYYLNAHYSGALLNYSVREQVNDVLPSFLVALGMGIIVYLVGKIPLTPFLLLLFQFLTGAVVLVVVCEYLRLQEYIELKGIFFSNLMRLYARKNN